MNFERSEKISLIGLIRSSWVTECVPCASPEQTNPPSRKQVTT